MLTEKEITAFEQRHSIVLPKEYRAFLLNVGPGAPGPMYPMLSLEEAMAERGDRSVYTLADPFLPPTSKDDFVALDTGGVLPISYDGCEYYHVIIVNGPDKGSIWYNVLERPGLVRAADDFDAWYAPKESAAKKSVPKKSVPKKSAAKKAKPAAKKKAKKR